jgi:hypothetical protein
MREESVIRSWAKIDELLNRHFPPIDPANEVLDPKLNINLPLDIAVEMKDYLCSLWEEEQQNGAEKTFEEIMGAGRLNQITYENYLDLMKKAEKDALKITLWEKITKTNYEDIATFRSILRSCTSEILEMMVRDFLNE